MQSVFTSLHLSAPILLSGNMDKDTHLHPMCDSKLNLGPQQAWGHCGIFAVKNSIIMKNKFDNDKIERSNIADRRGKQVF
jgi:hypothetical protein